MDEVEIRARIEIARRDHRDLDAAIDALRLMPNVDMIQLQRFKKRKLKLRDEIAMLEDMLIPDIIA
ncbi:MAG: YdcH family protein [Polymorphobacter sp.]